MTLLFDAPLWEYLTVLRKRAGLSLEELAKQAGYKGRSSIQRYFEKNDVEALSPSIASKFAQALLGKGQPPIDIYDLERLIFKPTDKTKLGEADPELIASMLNLLYVNDDRKRPVLVAKKGGIPLIGSAQTGSWMEEPPSIKMPKEFLDIPFVDYMPPEEIYALRVAGPALNRIVPNGFFALCQTVDDESDALMAGKYIHLQREKNSFYEWSIRRYEFFDGRAVLSFDSDDDEYSYHLDVEQAGSSISVVGAVLGWYRSA